MDIRTFEAFSMKEAVKAVKRDLGPNAVILSTKEKKTPMGQSTIFEVTAASHQPKGRAGASHDSVIDPNDFERMTKLQSTTEVIGAKLSTLCEHNATREQIQRLDAGLSEIKALLIENLRTKDGSVIAGLSPHLIPLDRQLRAMLVDDSLIVELMGHLTNLKLPSSDLQGDALESFARDQAIRWMMKKIKIAPRWNISPGLTSIHAFVGPTGVGKTSLIAKIAAHYSKRPDTPLLVVSMDQKRLAAAEQMRILCRIMATPFESAADLDDLKNTVAKRPTGTLVLLDTPGISPKDPASINKLTEMKAGPYPLDYHLVLSTTDKESHMDQAVRAFSRIGIHSVSFTKIDECSSFGEICNIGRRWSIPLAFFGTGRDIPEDLERASRERVVERIFGIS